MVFLADQDTIRAAKNIRKVDRVLKIAIGLEKDAILILSGDSAFGGSRTPSGIEQGYKGGAVQQE